MIVEIRPGTGFGSVSDCTGIVSHEQFTRTEFADLADLLEGLNTPGNGGTPIRRLTDLCWALQNDTSAFILTCWEG